MAVMITAEDLQKVLKLPAAQPGETDEDAKVRLATATRLLAVVTGEINLYAPDAPPSTANEAALRMAGYLYLTSDSAHLNSLKVHDVDLEFRSPAGSALRLSGGMALLSPYKRRRAAVCRAVAT